MPMITLTFNYPEAPLPKYKFGDRVALGDKCAPTNWLIGIVVGLTLDESYEPHWYYAVKLDAPCGLTEEYLEAELVSETKIHTLQLEWEKNNCNYANNPEPSPKFQSGTLVKFSKETGCNLLGNFATVVGSRYVSSDDWSGWVYQLSNKDLTHPIEIGEIWLEAYKAP